MNKKIKANISLLSDIIKGVGRYILLMRRLQPL